MTAVGLLGCGAMGAQIAEAICAKKAGDAVVSALFDQDISKAKSLADEMPVPVPYFQDLDGFLSTPQLDMVLECALKCTRCLGCGKGNLLQLVPYCPNGVYATQSP